MYQKFGIQLICNATGHPKSEILYYDSQGREVRSSEGVEISQSGTYECTAYNAVGWDSKQITISDPENISTFVPVEKPVKVLTLEAMVIFDRQLAVSWSKNGKLLEKNEHKEEFQVRIFDKQLSIFQNCFGNRSNLLRRSAPLKFER